MYLFIINLTSIIVYKAETKDDLIKRLNG